MADFYMEIKTLWGWRKGADTPELLEAWDEISVDENHNGWEQACLTAISSVGDDLHSYRYANLRVNHDHITRLWDIAEIEAEVRP